MDKQSAIPGPGNFLRPAPIQPARSQEGLIKALAARIRQLERENATLREQLSQAEYDDCYFYSEDRCLGRPADACPWSVKIGEWEWLCAYPWKGDQGGD